MTCLSRRASSRNVCSRPSRRPDHAALAGHDQHLARRDGDRDRRADAADDRHRGHRLAGAGQRQRGDEAARARHLGPLNARVTAVSAACHAVADDVQEVIGRVRRADDAVRAQLDRLDSAAHVAGHAIGAKVWPVVGFSRAVGAAFRMSRLVHPLDRPPLAPRTSRVSTTRWTQLMQDFDTRYNQPGGGFVTGLLFGAAVGAALGVIFAPRAGADTRRPIAESGEPARGALRLRAGAGGARTRRRLKGPDRLRPRPRGLRPPAGRREYRRRRRRGGLGPAVEWRIPACVASRLAGCAPAASRPMDDVGDAETPPCRWRWAFPRCEARRDDLRRGPMPNPCRDSRADVAARDGDLAHACPASSTCCCCSRSSSSSSACCPAGASCRNRVATACRCGVARFDLLPPAPGRPTGVLAMADLARAVVTSSGSMQAPPPVADETGRLEALQRYQVLETPPEEVLDDLTRIAAYVCQTPIALLTLVDAQRQWFKSRIGLSLSETPRRLSFGAHAIHAADTSTSSKTRFATRASPTIRSSSVSRHPVLRRCAAAHAGWPRHRRPRSRGCRYASWRRSRSDASSACSAGPWPPSAALRRRSGDHDAASEAGARPGAIAETPCASRPCSSAPRSRSPAWTSGLHTSTSHRRDPAHPPVSRLGRGRDDAEDERSWRSSTKHRRGRARRPDRAGDPRGRYGAEFRIVRSRRRGAVGVVRGRCLYDPQGPPPPISPPPPSPSASATRSSGAPRRIASASSPRRSSRCSG